MTKGFFITGTDTGVGKTIISAALIKIARNLGLSTCGMKPIETGCKTALSSQPSASGNNKNTLIPSDGIFLKDITDVNESIDLITPVRFENPLAPLPASEIEKRPVDIKRIKKAYAELSRKYDILIVEGIGGLLVPITKNYFVLDLAKAFGLPLIIVARPGLGTINHTILTVTSAINEGIDVAGVIINYTCPPEGTLAEDTNPGVIKKIIPIPIIGIFPYLKNVESSTIEKAAMKNLNLEIIKKYFRGVIRKYQGRL
jgi:dethiobiotin synthetase